MICLYYAGVRNQREPQGGAAIATLQFARALAASGAFRGVAVIGDEVTYAEDLGGVKLLPLPQEGERQSFLEQFSHVVFASHLRGFDRVRKRSGQRWYLIAHSFFIDEPEVQRKEEFDVVCAFSPPHRKNLCSQLGDSSKVKILGNILREEFVSLQEDVERNPMSIAYAGALVPHKCVHVLLQAYALLRESLSRVELHLYGSGALWGESVSPYEHELMATDLPAVHFHGAVPPLELQRAFSRHSVLAIPSTLESFSLVSIEAQSCGCLPVAHDAGGVSATMLPGKTGFLYSPNTPEELAIALANAMNVALEQPSRRAVAKDFVREQFSGEQVVSRFLSLDRL